METRFIQILTCKDCPFSGHKTDARINATTYFCTYPENMEIDQLPAEEVNGELYPITMTSHYDNGREIPFWCKLPSKVN